jgi:hypothetical protein
LAPQQLRWHLPHGRGPPKAARVESACNWCASPPYWAWFVAIGVLSAAAVVAVRAPPHLPRGHRAAVGAAALMIAGVSAGSGWTLVRESAVVGWRDLMLADASTVAHVKSAFAHHALGAAAPDASACVFARDAATAASGTSGVQTMLGAYMVSSILTFEAALEERGQPVCVAREDAERIAAGFERVWRRDATAARWSVVGWASPVNPLGPEDFQVSVASWVYNFANADVNHAKSAGMDEGMIASLDAERERTYARLMELLSQAGGP